MFQKLLERKAVCEGTLSWRGIMCQGSVVASYDEASVLDVLKRWKLWLTIYNQSTQSFYLFAIIIWFWHQMARLSGKWTVYAVQTHILFCIHLDIHFKDFDLFSPSLTKNFLSSEYIPFIFSVNYSITTSFKA